MSHISFKATDIGGNDVEFRVNVYGELFSSDDFDPEQEQMLMFMGVSKSPAYFLWEKWNELTRGLGYHTEDPGVILARLLSSAPGVADILLACHENGGDDATWADVIIDAVGPVMVDAFTALDEQKCMAVIDFLRTSGLDAWARIYEDDAVITQKSSWKIEFRIERSLHVSESGASIGPWFVYGARYTPDMFWIDLSPVNVSRPGSQSYDQAHLDLLDKIFKLLLPSVRYRYDELEPGSYNYIDLDIPRTGVVYFSTPSQYGLLYSRIRPHKHDRKDGPCNTGSPRSVFIPYVSLEDVTNAHRIAQEMNEDRGSCYEIRVMRRIGQANMEYDEVEERLRQDRGDHTKIGGYFDWLAQNWEEV